MIPETIVIKLGGSTLGGQAASGVPDTTLSDLIELKKRYYNLVVVHGGGNAINRLMQNLGQEPEFRNGLRVTSPSTLAAALMAMRGQVNAELVSAINRVAPKEWSAIGLCGLDGKLLQAQRLTSQGDIGLVGEIVEVNTSLLDTLLQNNFLPIIAPFALAVDSSNNKEDSTNENTNGIYNINADDVAAKIAATLLASQCIFLTDVAGVLDKTKQTIPQITPPTANDLIADGTIYGGMIPKIRSALLALEGCQKVLIINGQSPNALLHAVEGTVISGTTFSKS